MMLYTFLKLYKLFISGGCNSIQQLLFLLAKSVRPAVLPISTFKLIIDIHQFRMLQQTLYMIFLYLMLKVFSIFTISKVSVKLIV